MICVNIWVLILNFYKRTTCLQWPLLSEPAVGRYILVCVRACVCVFVCVCSYLFFVSIYCLFGEQHMVWVFLINQLWIQKIHFREQYVAEDHRRSNRRLVRFAFYVAKFRSTPQGPQLDPPLLIFAINLVNMTKVDTGPDGTVAKSSI